MRNDEDDEPLDSSAAAEAERRATEPVLGSLAQVLAELAVVDTEVDARQEGGLVDYVVGGVVFARIQGPTASFRLGSQVAAAAMRTEGARQSPLGPGWVAFTPRRFDRYAHDRASAWFALGRRLAGGD